MDKTQELFNYINLAHSKGIFLLQESDLLKKCKDVLLDGLVDSSVTPQVALNVGIQAILKGQKNGCYTLEEASKLFHLCQSFSSQPEPSAEPEHAQVLPEPSKKVPIKIEPKISEYFDDDDLSSLSDPVPLKEV